MLLALIAALYGLLQSIGFDFLFAHAIVYCDKKPRQVGRNHDYNMTFLFHLVYVSILQITANMTLKAKFFSRATNIVTSRGTTWRELSPYDARSSTDDALVVCYCIALISVCSNPLKRIPTQ